MSRRFSAFLTLENNTNNEIQDVQVVLNNEYTYLYQFGRVGARQTSGSRFGIIIDTGNADYWTVTYKDNGGKVLWIEDKKLSVKESDAGQNIKIEITSKDVTISTPVSKNKDTWSVATPS